MNGPALRKWSVGLLAAALIVTVAMIAFGNEKHGALAYSDARHRYGWAVNRPTQAAAERDALANCGEGCTVRLHWDHGCGAYAEGDANIHYGWAVHGDKAGVERQAIAACEAKGGRHCTIRASACN